MKSFKDSWTSSPSSSSSTPPSTSTTKGGYKITTQIVTQNIKPNSRFIRESERGWDYPDRPSTNSMMMRRSSSGQQSNNTSGNWSSIYTFKNRWNAPKVDPKEVEDERIQRETAGAVEELKGPEEEGDDDDTESFTSEVEDEDENVHKFGHGRERSSSVPDLTRLNSPTEDDRTYERPVQEESLSSKRGQHMKINLESLQSAVNKKHLHPDVPPTPIQLTNQNSITPSLELQKSRSSFQLIIRGYPWKPDPDSKNKNYVPPAHRNPTSLQAFYDTHFGSSSGFRSVAGLADDVFHPIGSARNMFNRLSVSKKVTTKEHHQNEEIITEKEVKQSITPPALPLPPQSTSFKENFLSWKSLPFSPAIFGMGSSSHIAPDQSSIKQQHSSHQKSTHLGAYEPELIPTIHRDPHANRYFKKVEGNVVILGGYRGSILRDASTHQMIWVPLKVGVNLRRPTLELGLTDQAETNSEELVIADEMLSGIGNMVDTGRRLITKLSNHKKRIKVHSWGYDWRLSLSKSSEKLERFLQELYEESSPNDQSERKGAKVIAHSMGGLVAMHALARTKNPKIFESLVFASTPFLGTANILGPFAFGDAALWNEEICSPRATFSFRSSFYLLPTNSKRQHEKENRHEQIDTEGGRCFEEEDGTPHDIDFLDPETWNDLGLSPCVKRGGRKAASTYLQRKAESQNSTKDEQIEQSLMQRDTSQISKQHSRDDPEKDKAENHPTMPGVNLSMDSSPKDNKAVKGINEAIKMGQEIAGGEDDTEETLQPENRGKKEGESVSNGEEISQEEEDSISWAFLERTLNETKQFFNELRTSFNQDLFDQNVYPPVSILTSGRTPTVRGALVWPKDSESLEKQEAKARSKNEDEVTNEDHPDKDHWKRTARLTDYSRMLYAPGDGVILRESSISLPGQWGKLLVKSKESVDENGKHPLTNDEGVVETSHRHVTLLSDVDGIGRCLEACRRARLNDWSKKY